MESYFIFIGAGGGGSDLDPGQFMFRRRKATFKVVVHGISEENPHTVNLPHKALCQKLQGDANRREGERLYMHRKTSLVWRVIFDNEK
ncbi:hypothetical protein NC653_032783 [Populus alba x Populus x berolinensis]|uniref:Uncharacterized protein n=2 Tax=Populus alba x Populus x berolinensis TaxID=444605 RepID=A0AAD6LS82_9ROSI|nr:hypothetical protein NC653_032783 [Populus alba x Populus x berolinensis]